MNRQKRFCYGYLVLIKLAVLASYFSGWSLTTAAGLVLNTFRSANSPTGSTVVEIRGDAIPADSAKGAEAASSSPDAGSWSSYNRTITSQRYSPLRAINMQTVRELGLPLISVPKVPVGFLGNYSGCSEFL
jgi:alcohol dehydrogenase (cytochrome c)